LFVKPNIEEAPQNYPTISVAIKSSQCQRGMQVSQWAGGSIDIWSITSGENQFLCYRRTGFNCENL